MMEFRSARRHNAQAAVGHNIVNGRPHGFNWKPIFSVTVSFDTEKEADDFYNSIWDKKALQGEIE